MKKHEIEILDYLLKHPDGKKQDLKRDVEESKEKIDLALDQFIQTDYLDVRLVPTEKAYAEMDRRKPRHAIILAAGFGMRMVPINTKTPKGLLEVQGERLIERLIRQLHEAGVAEIDVVVGFLSEKFDYLTEKFGVNLVYNDEYASKNNLHSLCLAADKMANTYILPSDIWSRDNPFSKKELYSWYAVSEKTDAESTVRVDDQGEWAKAAEQRNGQQMIGIAYLLEEEAVRLRERLNQMCTDPTYEDSFWEDALFAEDVLPGIYPKVFAADAVQEINTYEDLRSLDQQSTNLNTSIIELIAKKMQVAKESIKNIAVLKKGMTNRSFKFTVNEQPYIMRIPGEGTDQLIDRHQEYQVYQILKGSQITDEVVYISPETGYKITKFWDSARECDPFVEEDVEKCMETLRAFHAKKFQVDHVFDLFEKIDFYERLWDGQVSMFEDYGETKKNVFSLQEIIEQLPKEWVLSHIDAVPDNFLMLEGEQVRLIDWEYAGMQDPHVDIAMFAIYSLYDREKVDQLIDIYFKESCPAETRMKIYGYIAIAGLLWSNWCEYKRFCGVDFGDYALAQYDYAKDYYDLVMKEFAGEVNRFEGTE